MIFIILIAIGLGCLAGSQFLVYTRPPHLSDERLREIGRHGLIWCALAFLMAGLVWWGNR